MRPNGVEWIVILVIVVLLWGSTKLPAAAKGIAQSLKIFKKEMKSDAPESTNKEDKSSDNK
ncbi:MAG: hypothetical protein RLZZ400_591 [Actinomycetota bacterium]|jgi:sec-independent protein translocase protein TatA